VQDNEESFKKFEPPVDDRDHYHYKYHFLVT